jgi:hypothetical protein
MFPDQPFDPAQLGAAKATAVRQPRWLEPELGPATISLDVYVGRLVAVSGVEEEPVRPRDRSARSILTHQAEGPSSYLRSSLRPFA